MQYKLLIPVLMMIVVGTTHGRSCSKEEPICYSMCDVEGPWPVVTITGPVLEWPCAFLETKVIVISLNQDRQKAN